MHLYNDVSSQIKILRKKSGLTQADCAHLLGVSQSRISAIETGRALPAVSEIAILALAYGKPLDSLLAGQLQHARTIIGRRLGSMPPCPPLWLGRGNRHRTLNDIANRLEALDRRDHGRAA